MNIFQQCFLTKLLNLKQNEGARYIPELYERGVRNFVVTQEEFNELKSKTFMHKLTYKKQPSKEFLDNMSV